MKNKNLPFSLCVFRDRGGDLSKRWYVEFYVWDVYKNKKVRVMDRSINHHKHNPKYGGDAAKIRSAMYSEMYAIKNAVDEKLKAGWFIDSKPEIETPKKSNHPINKNSAFSEAIRIFYDQKKLETNSDKTKAAYITFSGMVNQWLTETGRLYIPVHSINYDVAFGFMQWYQSRKNKFTGEPVSNNSYNKQLIMWRAFFNDLVDRDIIEKNPAKRIKKLKTLEQSHEPYLDREIERIKEQLQKVDPQLLVVCEVIYYCAIRRHELRYAQVHHIRDGKWLIPGKITHNGKTIKVSKNGLAQSVVVPQQILSKIQSLGWLDYPEHYFLFGGRGTPSARPHGRDNLTTRYREKVKVPLNLTPEKTLYGWKHTGVCKLYKKFKDPDMVRRHCRHSTLEMTMIYLRQLGLFDQNEIAESFPDF